MTGNERVGISEAHRMQRCGGPWPTGDAMSGSCSNFSDFLTSEGWATRSIKSWLVAGASSFKQHPSPPPPQMSPPSHIPSSGPNDSTLTYPPAARVKTDKQPAPRAEMTLSPGQETGAQRLRGGCIPCPVRVTAVTSPPVQCPFADRQSDRMDAASVSQSPAVADRV